MVALPIYIVAAEAAVVHRVEHVDSAVLDKLHQILVAANDGGFPSRRLRRHHIAGDDVVRLQPFLLDARDGEGTGGVADQRELRHQLGRRRRPVRLVLVVHQVARSEEHTSELQSLMRISYAVFCLKKKNTGYTEHTYT